MFFRNKQNKHVKNKSFVVHWTKELFRAGLNAMNNCFVFFSSLCMQPSIMHISLYFSFVCFIVCVCFFFGETRCSKSVAFSIIVQWQSYSNNNKASNYYFTLYGLVYVKNKSNINNERTVSVYLFMYAFLQALVPVEVFNSQIQLLFFFFVSFCFEFHCHHTFYESI